jgi:PleD family two-component response regulator
MAYGIVRQHDGYIAVESEVGVGTAVQLYLPMAANITLPHVTEEAPLKQEVLTGSETILVVEDGGLVRLAIRNALRQNGYAVIEAETGEEALQKAAVYEGAIHLLLTDIIMPGMNGQELAQQIAAHSPTTAVLYMSG